MRVVGKMLALDEATGGDRTPTERNGVLISTRLHAFAQEDHALTVS